MVVPEVFGAFFDEAIGEGFDVVVRGEGAVGGGGGGLVVGGEGGADVGANASLVELLLLFDESVLFVSGELLVHALPLPLVHAAGKGSGTATHASERNPVPVARCPTSFPDHPTPHCWRLQNHNKGF